MHLQAIKIFWGGGIVIRHYVVKVSRMWGLPIGLVLVVCALNCKARGEDISIAVLLQQSPTRAGTVIPSPGIHRFSLHSEVTLTAVARPGYEFAYWLGEVADPTASRTIACIDKPKIIIAVFRESEYQISLLTRGRANRSSSGGASASGETFSSAGDIIQPKGSFSSGGGSTSRGSGTKAEDIGPEPPNPPEPPTPEPSVPEPATCLLLLAGSALFLPRRHTK
jgi:uncharacterized membrane protein YgcG